MSESINRELLAACEAARFRLVHDLQKEYGREMSKRQANSLIAMDRDFIQLTTAIANAKSAEAGG